MYVTGLCENAGTFTYLKNGKSTNLRFAVKLPEKDKHLIFRLQRYFQVGNVYHTGTSWMYCATSLTAVEKIVGHFDLYPLQGHKQAEFEIWRNMFELKRIPRKSDPAAVNALADQLSALRIRQ